MKLEEQFASKFACPKCKNRGAKVKRVAVSGRGISKILDIQHNQFMSVSCTNCGFTEFYNPEVLEGKKHLGTIIDILWGN